jgi:hypothetical protein
MVWDSRVGRAPDASVTCKLPAVKDLLCKGLVEGKEDSGGARSRPHPNPQMNTDERGYVDAS